MITLVHVNELNKISNMPKEVQEIVLNILTVLDDSYGETRVVNDMGGYVAIIKEQEDLNKFNEVSLNFKEDVTCEYVDKIVTNKGETYLNAMVLLSDDYSISFIIKLCDAPDGIINQI
ncbi:MAG: hypothetical protein ACRC57_06600 [Sarcina sp.]